MGEVLRDFRAQGEKIRMRQDVPVPPDTGAPDSTRVVVKFKCGLML